MIMKNLLRVLSLVALGFAANAATAAESKAVQTMAGILTTMQHFPNAADKEALAKIVDDKATTADEKTVAKALTNVQHKVAAGDKAALDAIVADAKASSGVKTLAGVIVGLNHMASAADKEKLAALK
jgi:hypothetical protein